MSRIIRAAPLLLASCIVLAIASSTAVAQTIRPRASLAFGTGVQQANCTACADEPTGALSVNAELGATRPDIAWLAVRVSGWTEVDLIESPPYVSSLVALIAGYQVKPALGAYVGVGRSAEAWSSSDVTSSGAAVLGGVEAVLGRRRGIGARFHVEWIQRISGERRFTFEGETFRTPFRPRFIQAGVGVIWR